MVLLWSRALFLRFYLSAAMPPVFPRTGPLVLQQENNNIDTATADRFSNGPPGRSQDSTSRRLKIASMSGPPAHTRPTSTHATTPPGVCRAISSDGASPTSRRGSKQRVTTRTTGGSWAASAPPTGREAVVWIDGTLRVCSLKGPPEGRVFHPQGTTRFSGSWDHLGRVGREIFRPKGPPDFQAHGTTLSLS